MLTEITPKSTIKVKVLIIEDEGAIRHLLKSAFSGTEFRLLEATTGEEGISITAKENPELILLDLGLPDIDGTEVIKTIREWSSVPIIVLSARGSERQKVTCLELGADDYMTKPFGVSELMARMKVALRRHSRSSKDDQPVFESGDLKVDLSARRVWRGEQEIHLTPLEYKLLAVLIQHAGKVVTHRQLLTEVWGAQYSEEAQYLRVYMGYLRRKIEPSPLKPQTLLTEPRVGYRLAV